MSPRLAFAVHTVHRAGRLTLKYFQTGAQVKLKGDQSPVTLADTEAEELIRHDIHASYPGEPVLGEEQGLQGHGDDRWVIDPIDGTKSFVCGVPLYATLLSYEQAGEPVLGVCYFPALDELYCAESGGGAYLNGRPIQVSQQSVFEHAAISCGSVVRLQSMNLLTKILKASQDALTLRTWADAYGHALVAAGRIDAMIDPVVSRWDISAMKIIVSEAGGIFTSLDGLTQISESALSANPVLHSKLLSLLNSESL